MANDDGIPGDVDLVLASDMLDLPSFLGHAPRHVADASTVLYMHENQLTYPLSPTARDDLAYAYINWSSMVRADEVWFNSVFHLESVLTALPKFIRHFPDHRHTSLLTQVADKSRVAPVGVELGWVTQTAKAEPPLIVWNQRWEYDKDPVRLFGALYRLAESGAAFRLAICGENFRNVPEEFEEAKSRLAEFIVQFGYAESDRYRETLLDASVVISTARHEFFGIGAVEAMACGALPVFPSDLSYPELIPSELHDRTLYADDDELDHMLITAFGDPLGRRDLGAAIAVAAKRFDWPVVAAEYDSSITALTTH